MRDGVLVELGVVQQCFGGNAAPIQAHATQFAPLNAGDLHSKLGSADGADVGTIATQSGAVWRRRLLDVVVVALRVLLAEARRAFGTLACGCGLARAMSLEQRAARGEALAEFGRIGVSRAAWNR